MAFALVQGGTTLQMITEAGVLSSLTLPTGVTLSSARPPRFAVFGRYVIMVNTPTRPITIDSLGVVRVLCPNPPPQALTLASGGAGGLTGAYLAKQTFVIRDRYGNILAESDYGPAMAAAVTLTSNDITISGVNLSNDAITGYNLYRTTAGGTVYFKWREMDGNIQTSADDDDLADGTLDNFAAPALGTPPNMSLIAEWRRRLWGVDKAAIDDLRYSEAGIMYAWPAANVIPISKVGEDSRGVVGLVPRRESLVTGRRNTLSQITGTSAADFRNVKLSENVGIESNESIAIYRDTAFWLWKDGVYMLDTEGIKCISDGKVRNWFITSDTFNRSEFDASFGAIDPVNLKYRLYLASAGQATIDRWVEYDLVDKTWWGPHRTADHTPASLVMIPNADDVFELMEGSSAGFLHEETATRTDGTATAISTSIEGKFHDAGTPDIEKHWGELTMISAVQTAGFVTITPRTGNLDVGDSLTIPHDLTKGRQRHRRLGRGKFCRLAFTHSTNAQRVQLYGYEIPFHELGRR
jgi:hypothetical protein